MYASELFIAFNKSGMNYCTYTEDTIQEETLMFMPHFIHTCSDALEYSRNVFIVVVVSY